MPKPPSLQKPTIEEGVVFVLISDEVTLYISPTDWLALSGRIIRDLRRLAYKLPLKERGEGCNAFYKQGHWFWVMFRGAIHGTLSRHAFRNLTHIILRQHHHQDQFRLEYLSASPRLVPANIWQAKNSGNSLQSLKSLLGMEGGLSRIQRNILHQWLERKPLHLANTRWLRLACRAELPSLEWGRAPGNLARFISCISILLSWYIAGWTSASPRPLCEQVVLSNMKLN